MKTHLLANFQLLLEVDADKSGHHKTITKKIQALCGEGVLPNDTVDFFDLGAHRLAHFSSDAADLVPLSNRRQTGCDPFWAVNLIDAPDWRL